MDDFYSKYMDRYKQPKEFNDAIVISPIQAQSFKKFIEITEKNLIEIQLDHEEYKSDIDNDLNIIQLLKNKADRIINNTQSPITLMEGILLVNLMMTFKHRHYDIDAISEDVEYIAEQIETLYYEKGYVQIFHLIKEEKLA